MCVCTSDLHKHNKKDIYMYMYNDSHNYMKIHVPSMLAKGIETINKQTQQTMA